MNPKPWNPQGFISHGDIHFFSIFMMTAAQWNQHGYWMSHHLMLWSVHVSRHDVTAAASSWACVCSCITTSEHKTKDGFLQRLFQTCTKLWIICRVSPASSLVKFLRMSEWADVRGEQDIHQRIHHQPVCVLMMFLSCNKDAMRAFGDKSRWQFNCGVNKNTWSPHRN